jgi:hypothetical protein
MSSLQEYKSIKTDFHQQPLDYRQLDKQKPFRYDKLKTYRPIDSGSLKYNFLEDIIIIKKSVSEIRAYIESTNVPKQISVGQGGGDMSQEIIEKVHSIDLRLTRTETIVTEMNTKLDKMDVKLEKLDSKISDLPTKADMTSIVYDVIQKLDLPSKDYVGKLSSNSNTEIQKKHVQIITWVVGTGLIAAGATFTLIKMFI